MRTQAVTLGSATFSEWYPMNSKQTPFNVGISVTLTPSASLTYSVQHTSDNLFERTSQCSFSRTTTAVSVTQIAHGLSVGDWVHVEGANTISTDVFDGDFAVAAISSADIFTYTVANTGATVGKTGARISTAKVRENANLSAATASGDTNYAFPCRAVRLKITTYSSGTATMTINQGS